MSCRPRPGRVVALRLFPGRAARASSRISCATVFLLTVQPASCRSVVIRGDPHLPSCALNRRAISALSRSRRAARAGSVPADHLQNQDGDTPAPGTLPRAGYRAGPSGRR